MVWRIIKYLEHQLYRRHRKGRGIHPPYLFSFVHDVVFNTPGTDIPHEISEMHRNLWKDRTMIGERTVGSFVCGSSVSPRYGELLFRITRWFCPDMILELGTGLGVSTMYLGQGYPGVPLHSIEGNTERAAFAAQLVCRCHLEQVSIHWGDLDRKLEEILPQLDGRFVAFVDANHSYEPTIRYVRAILEKAGDEAVIIMDDIYWSRGMSRAWKEVISWPGISVSIDLFHMGILLLRKDLNKAHVKIKS
ncbi:MAG: class I SAM-dependent methyltransferase [Bacteroidales bacterium]|nr:class I SAM-dependent methyltransferase [Bacteroidales bacterium]